MKKNLSISSFLVVIILLGISPMKSFAQNYQLPSNIIKLSGGLSFITSKIYIEDEINNKVKWYQFKPGVTAAVEYEYITGSGWGFGWNFIYNDTRFPQSLRNSTKSHQALRQIYFGPSAVKRILIRDRWCLEGAAGLGYAYLGGDVADNAGLGIMLKTGIDYMLSKHIAIGAEINEVFAITGINDNDYMKRVDPDEYRPISGTFRLDLGAGIRFYF